MGIDKSTGVEFPKGMNIGADQENNRQSTSSLQAEKRNALIDFTERTTFHGIRYIVEEGCIFRR